MGRILEADARAPRDQNGYVGILPFRQRFDYSYEGALRSIDDSLQRLGLAYLDIVYIHDIDAATHGPDQPRQFRAAMEGAYRALARLRDEKVIAGVGLDVNDWQVCLDALRDGRRPYFNYAPAPEEIIARVAAIEQLCLRFDVPLRAAALQFPLGHPQS